MAEPTVKKVSAAGLLVRKVAFAFALGFLAYLLPAMLDVLDAIRDGQDIELGWALVISLVTGGVAAALRAVIALSPVNLMPTDALHTLGKDRPKAVTVDERVE